MGRTRNHRRDQPESNPDLRCQRHRGRHLRGRIILHRSGGYTRKVPSRGLGWEPILQVSSALGIDQLAGSPASPRVPHDRWEQSWPRMSRISHEIRDQQMPDWVRT